MILDMQGPGEYVGEMALDGKPRSASVMTLEPSTFAVVAREPIREAIRGNPDFALEMISKIIDRARIATSSVKDLALLDVYGRVARLLLNMAVERDGRLAIPEKLTQQEIAERVGASRDMVSRIFRDLTPKEIVTAVIKDYFDEEKPALNALIAGHEVQYPYAYHFNAAELALYLQGYATGHGVKRIVDDVVEVVQDEQGAIAGVRTKENGLITADLFVDCTGFRGLLINKTLDEPFISFNDTLLNDRGLRSHSPTASRRAFTKRRCDMPRSASPSSSGPRCRMECAITRVTAPSTLWRQGSFQPQGKQTSWKNIHTSSPRRLASHSAKGTFIAL